MSGAKFLPGFYQNDKAVFIYLAQQKSYLGLKLVAMINGFLVNDIIAVVKGGNDEIIIRNAGCNQNSN